MYVYARVCMFFLNVRMLERAVMYVLSLYFWSKDRQPRTNTTRLSYKIIDTMGNSWYAKHVVMEMAESTGICTFALTAMHWKTGSTLLRLLWTIGNDAVEKKTRWNAYRILDDPIVGIQQIDHEKKESLRAVSGICLRRLFREYMNASLQIQAEFHTRTSEGRWINMLDERLIFK